MSSALSVAYDVFLTAGVALLGFGFFWKDRRAHLARATGWSVFGLFWFLHVPDYAIQEDALNALGAAVALPVFLFVAYHEWLSYAWRGEDEPLPVACGAAFFAVAASLMLSTRDPWKRKAIALAIVLPVTWVMNLVRNAVVIYFFGVRGDPFELVHNWYGKTLSLAVLLVLVFVAFKLLPELYLNINGLFELPWRKGPHHDYRRFVGRLSRKKSEPPTTPATGTATNRSGSDGAGQTPPSSP